jgi:hypothetical protein
MINGMNVELGLIISCVIGKRIDKVVLRFRDIFTEDKDCPYEGYDFLIYTRMGGGNYEHWSECSVEEPCPFCKMLEIEEWPGYIGGYDDDFDCSYRTLAFKFTPEQKELFNKVQEEGLGVLKDDIKRIFPDLYYKIMQETAEIKTQEEAGNG